MIGIIDYVKIGAGIIIGVFIMVIVNVLIRDPLIRYEARSGYVVEAEKIAAEAKIAERDRQIKAGEFVIESYQVQLKNSRDADAKKTEQSEQEIMEYEKRMEEIGNSCRLDSNDIEWLRQ